MLGISMIHRAVICIGILGLVTLVATVASAGKRPPKDLLGIRVGMEDHEARERLTKMGTPVSKLESPKQTWNLRDRRYGSLTIRYDSRWRVSWMTAFAREGGARVRYRDIGDLDQAHHGGNYVYTWTLPLSKGAAPMAITARGPDATYLSSISIHAPGPASATPANQTTHQKH
jgi:hypothetical protein